MTTPMMIQWQTCKTQAKEALLFFRLGDFYEAFYDDAKIIAKELSLTLTQRQNIPMCGVPFHASEQYIDKLIARGFKIAVAEQTEDPKAAKGLVRREITQILTPGTIQNSQLLNAKKNNYIASLTQLGSVFGLALLDLSTGEFRSIEIEKEEELLDELYRFKPAEFLVSKKFQTAKARFFEELSHSWTFVMTIREEWQFGSDAALKTLLDHFQVQTLDGFGLRGQIAAISASGALLTYLKEDLALRLEHVINIQSDQLSKHMAIDRSAMKSLELTESLQDGSTKNTLLELLDHTSTPMGARLLRQWLRAPLLQVAQIQSRQDEIAAFLQRPELMKALLFRLENVRDIERLIAKVAARCAMPKDVLALGLSLKEVPLINPDLPDISQIAHEIVISLAEHPPIRIGEGDLFRDGIYPELDEQRLLSRDSQSWIARYQVQLREESGIKTLKVGYTKAFGYYIEVSRAKGESVPDYFQRSQTLVNAERFVTQELKHYEQQVLLADERAKAIEVDLFEKLRSKIAAQGDRILAIAKAIARIDAHLSLAISAKEHNFNRPLVDETDALHIEAGRHPVIERAIGQAHFISNDTLLNTEEQRLLLITGPNMAGKSTYIRQVALIVILAQIGSFVPAASARIGLVDKLFCRIGASDDLARGQSTFMVEMSETANILHNATGRSLVILDEIGRGTSTYDGISIARAVAEHLLAKKTKTLFATHYWELTALEKEQKGALNVHVAIQETESGIVFLRKIVSGSTDRSYGIHVAKLAGLPSSVVKRAEEILVSLEGGALQKSVRKKQVESLPLFDAPILDRLRRLDTNQLTPMQALQTLIELQKQLIS